MGNRIPIHSVEMRNQGGTGMKGIIAYMLGIPIVVIILLYLTGIF